MHLSFRNLKYISIYVLLGFFLSCKRDVGMMVDSDFYIELVSKNPTCMKCDLQLAQLNEIAEKYQEIVTIYYVQPFEKKELQNKSSGNDCDNIRIIFNTKLYQEKSKKLDVPYLMFMTKNRDTIQIDYKWNFNLSKINETLAIALANAQ